jgi:hypothetical protein
MQWEGFPVCKNSLRDAQMISSAAVVNETARLASDLTRQEARGPGDMENAWRRLETKYGVPWRTFWSLRYRRPKEIAATIYLRLQAAYAAECQRQMRRLEHDIAITKAKAGADHAAVRAAEALVGKVEE